MADDATSPASTADTVIAAARSGEPDRYLAALLAPPASRAGLLALAAFSVELARIPFVAKTEATIGEIRLQWWRDALQSPASSRTGSPVADALKEAVERHALSPALLLDMIEARSFDLSGEPVTDDAVLRDRLWKSDGAQFALAAQVLSREPSALVQAAAREGGYAYGLTRLLLDLGRPLSQGRVPLPQTSLHAAGVPREQLLAGEFSDNVANLLATLRGEVRPALNTSRKHVADLPREMRVAFLPLALVAPYLRALERSGGDVVRGPTQILPLTRVLRITLAYWLGRI